MKYILTNDIKSFYYNYKKYIFIYFLIIISFVFIEKLVGVPCDDSLFLSAVGINLNYNGGILDGILMFFFHFGVNLFIIFQIFNNDIKNGMSNIFLRMTIFRWIIYKIISIFILNFIILFLTYVVTNIYFIINGILIKQIFNYFIFNLFFALMIEYVYLLVYFIHKKWPMTLSFAIIANFILLKKVNIYILEKNIILIIISIIISIISILMINKKRLINIFE